MADTTQDPQDILDDIRTRLGSPPEIGEYSSHLEGWLKAYLAAGRPLTPLLHLPFAWQAPICECLCGVGGYATSALGVRVTLRCQAPEVHIETGKRSVPAPMRVATDGAWVKGRGLGRTLHLTTVLHEGEEVDLDAFYALAALRRWSASAWTEILRASSSSLPQTDAIVEAGYTVAGAAVGPTVRKSKKGKD